MAFPRARTTSLHELSRSQNTCFPHSDVVDKMMQENLFLFIFHVFACTKKINNDPLMTLHVDYVHMSNHDNPAPNSNQNLNPNPTHEKQHHE